MTRQEIEARSGAKVKQFMEMAKTLHIRVEAKNRLDEKGILEPTVFYIDDEKYEMDPPAAPIVVAPEPTGETGEEL